ncbi:MAG TPA: hypothetical protein VNH11_31530 [Pirellulales bacterium]|nr:hypothetical protein [Pirellulales bacterium]
MTIDAREVVGAGFPPTEGERLAVWLMEQGDLDWHDLTIDVRRCPPALLISAFFNAFLQKIFEVEPARLELARSIKWQPTFPFQEKNIKEWVDAFSPFTPTEC